MAVVSRACDLLWSCFAWGSDEETEQIVQHESVPPIPAMDIEQNGVVGSDAAAPTYEERINSLEQAIRRLSAENEALRAHQLETNDTVQTLREDLTDATVVIERHESRIVTINEQMNYMLPRDFVAYDSNQSNQQRLRQRPSIEATYSPNYRAEE